MLQINHLSLYLKKDFRVLIEDFSLSVYDQQQKIALIGEEGNGKSTLLKAIYDPASIASYVEMSGTIQNSGAVIAYLPQMIGEDWGDLSASEVLNRDIPWQNFDYKLYYSFLSGFKLPDEIITENLRAQNLSGGEKIKFQLLLCMLRHPSLLLLDEPSNDLDIESIELLESFIRRLDIPVIFASHDEDLLKNTATTIIHFEQLVHKTIAQHSIYVGDYATYINERARLISLQNQQHKSDQARFQEKHERYQQIYERVQHELRTVSRQAPGVAKNLKDKMRSVKAQGKRLEKEKAQLTPQRIVEDAIDLKFDQNLSVPNGKKVLDFQLDELKVGDNVLSEKIRLNIWGSDKVCLIGPNGSGKSSLLKIIREKLENCSVKIGYMPQVYAENLDATRTPVEFLTRDFSKDEHTKIRTYLGSLNFTPEEMLRPIASLSGGQKAKLYFVKMIFDEAEFLILDEPTRNLSPLSAPELCQALRAFPGPILAVSHDRAFIREVFAKVYQLTPQGLEDVLPDDLP